MTTTDLSDAGLDELSRICARAFVDPNATVSERAYATQVEALVKEVRELRASAKRSAELERIQCGEGSRRSPQGALAHGMGEDFGPLEGCGIRCNVRSQAYRCAECSVAFCKACLIKHFAKSEKHADAKLNAIESWIAEVEQLRSQLAATERARDEAMEALRTFRSEAIASAASLVRMVGTDDEDTLLPREQVVTVAMRLRDASDRAGRAALSPKPDADTR